MKSITRTYSIDNESDIGSWATATAYVYGNIVTKDGKFYICRVAHASDVFSTDLSNGKWALDTNDIKSGIKLAHTDGVTNEWVPIVRSLFDSIKVRIDGKACTFGVEYYIYDHQRDFPNGRSTGIIGFVDTLPAGTVVVIESDESYAMEVSGIIATSESRISSLEADVAVLEGKASAAETSIQSLQAADTALGLRIDAVENRATALELTDSSQAGINASYLARINELERIQGKEYIFDINNNQTTPLAISQMQFDNAEFTSAVIDYEIQRTSNPNYRAEVGTLHVFYHQKDGAWYVNKGLVVITEAEVEFTISTIAGVGTVFYTSSDISGGGAYSGFMKIRIRKFGV